MPTQYRVIPPTQAERRARERLLAGLPLSHGQITMLFPQGQTYFERDAKAELRRLEASRMAKRLSFLIEPQRELDLR